MKKILILFLMMILFVFTVIALTPQDNWNFRNFYNITGIKDISAQKGYFDLMNGSTVNITHLCLNDTCILGWGDVNHTGGGSSVIIDWTNVSFYNQSGNYSYPQWFYAGLNSSIFCLNGTCILGWNNLNVSIPAGNNKDVQFNDNGVMNGTDNLFFDKSIKALYIDGQTGASGTLVLKGGGDGTTYSKIQLGNSDNSRYWLISHTEPASILGDLYFQYYDGTTWITKIRYHVQDETLEIINKTLSKTLNASINICLNNTCIQGWGDVNQSGGSTVNTSDYVSRNGSQSLYNDWNAIKSIFMDLSNSSKVNTSIICVNNTCINGWGNVNQSGGGGTSFDKTNIFYVNQTNTITKTNNFNVTQYFNQMISVDGTNAPRGGLDVQNGGNLWLEPLGLDVGYTLNSTLANQGAGNVDNGLHTYMFTLGSVTGTDSYIMGTGATTTVTVVNKATNGKVNITVTFPAGFVTYRHSWLNIFRTVASNDGTYDCAWGVYYPTPVHSCLYYVGRVAIAEGGTEYKYQDNIADSTILSNRQILDSGWNSIYAGEFEAIKMFHRISSYGITFPAGSVIGSGKLYPQTSPSGAFTTGTVKFHAGEEYGDEHLGDMVWWQSGELNNIGIPTGYLFQLGLNHTSAFSIKKVGIGIWKPVATQAFDVNGTAAISGNFNVSNILKVYDGTGVDIFTRLDVHGNTWLDGKVSQKTIEVIADYTANNERTILVDSSGVGTCSGSPTYACNYWSSEGDCNFNNYHGGCGWVGASCTDGCSGCSAVGQGDCGTTYAGCSWVGASCTDACDGCTGLGDGISCGTTYPGCGWSDTGSSCTGTCSGCSSYNNDPTNCATFGGCYYTDTSYCSNSCNCDVGDNNKPTCDSYPSGCGWSDTGSSCSGGGAGCSSPDCASCGDEPSCTSCGGSWTWSGDCYVTGGCSGTGGSCDASCPSGCAWMAQGTCAESSPTCSGDSGTCGSYCPSGCSYVWSGSCSQTGNCNSGGSCAGCPSGCTPVSAYCTEGSGCNAGALCTGCPSGCSYNAANCAGDSACQSSQPLCIGEAGCLFSYDPIQIYLGTCDDSETYYTIKKVDNTTNTVIVNGINNEGTLQYNLTGDSYMSADFVCSGSEWYPVNEYTRNEIYFKDASKIYTDGLNLIFDTNLTGNEGIGYFSGNISATGFITRTEVWDITQGDALDNVKLSNELLTANGDINESAFIEKVDIKKRVYVGYKNVTQKYCQDNGICYNRTVKEDIYNDIIEQGVDVTKMVAKHENALAEYHTAFDVIQTNNSIPSPLAVAENGIATPELYFMSDVYDGTMTTSNLKTKEEHMDKAGNINYTSFGDLAVKAQVITAQPILDKGKIIMINTTKDTYFVKAMDYITYLEDAMAQLQKIIESQNKSIIVSQTDIEQMKKDIGELQTKMIVVMGIEDNLITHQLDEKACWEKNIKFEDVQKCVVELG